MGGPKRTRRTTPSQSKGESKAQDSPPQEQTNPPRDPSSILGDEPNEENSPRRKDYVSETPTPERNPPSPPAGNVSQNATDSSPTGSRNGYRTAPASHTGSVEYLGDPQRHPGNVNPNVAAPRPAERNTLRFYRPVPPHPRPFEPYYDFQYPRDYIEPVLKHIQPPWSSAPIHVQPETQTTKTGGQRPGTELQHLQTQIERLWWVVTLVCGFLLGVVIAWIVQGLGYQQ